MKKTLVSGLGAWLIQRLSAVYLLFFFLFLLGYFAFFPAASYEAWRDLVSSTPVVVASIIFFIALLAHAWVGLRDVILDYVKPLALRMTMLMLLALGLIGTAAWAAQVLLTAGA